MHAQLAKACGSSDQAGQLQKNVPQRNSTCRAANTPMIQAAACATRCATNPAPCNCSGQSAASAGSPST